MIHKSQNNVNKAWKQEIMRTVKVMCWFTPESQSHELNKLFNPYKSEMSKELKKSNEDFWTYTLSKQADI